jgi:hypothetical protein
VNLRDALVALGKDVVKALNDGQREGKIRPIEVPYIRRTVEIDTFERDFFTFTIRSVPSSRTEWTTPLARPMGDPQFVKNPSFKEAAMQIREMSELNEQESNSWTFHFVNRIAKDRLQNGRARPLTSWARMFESDILHKPKRFFVKAHLRGMGLKSEKIDLGKILLRRPISEDLDIEYREGSAFFSPGLSLNSLPDAILDVEFEAVDQQDYHNQLNRLLTAFKLFRLGSVFVQRQSFNAESIIHTNGDAISMKDPSIYFRYDLAEDDILSLRRFLRAMVRKIPDSWYTSPLEQENELSIAYQRYNTALFEDGIPAKRLSTAIMGLEALFLRADEKAELTRRLTQRVSRFVSYYDYDVLETQRRLVKCYRIRSKYVHGSVAKNNQEEVKDLSQFSMEILRICILAMLTKKQPTKSQFLKELDNVLIGNKDSESKLEAIVMNSLEVLVDYAESKREGVATSR